MPASNDSKKATLTIKYYLLAVLQHSVTYSWLELFRKSFWAKMAQWLDVLLC